MGRANQLVEQVLGRVPLEPPGAGGFGLRAVAREVARDGPQRARQVARVAVCGQEQVERLAPALDALWPLVRKTLDRDLSATDPAIVFRADSGAGK